MEHSIIIFMHVSSVRPKLDPYIQVVNFDTQILGTRVCYVINVSYIHYIVELANEVPGYLMYMYFPLIIPGS